MSIGMKKYLDEIGVDLPGFVHLLKHGEIIQTPAGNMIDRTLFPLMGSSRDVIIPGIFEFIHSEARRLTDAAQELLKYHQDLTIEDDGFDRLRRDCVAIGGNVDSYTRRVSTIKPWKKLRYEQVNGASFWRDANDNPISNPKTRRLPFADVPTSKSSMVMVDAEDGSPLTPAMCMMSTKFYKDSTGMESAESFLIDMPELFLCAPCGMTTAGEVLVELLSAAEPMLRNMTSIAEALNEHGYLEDKCGIYDLAAVERIVRAITAEDNPNAIIEIGSFS